MVQIPPEGPVGLVVEGPCEVLALPILLQHAGHRVATPVTFHGQGIDSPVDAFVSKRVMPTAKGLVAARRVSALGIVFDRESRPEPALQLCRRAYDVAIQALPPSLPIFVAVADRSFENWLLADPEGILTHALVVRDPANRVGSMSDGKDGVSILRWAFGDNDYEKVRHAPQLAGVVDVRDDSVLSRSPSLTAFLKLATR